MPRSSLFLPWDRPFLPQLVDYVLSFAPSSPIDLSKLLIIVPTQQAGRRLRRALAIAAASQHSGVLAPRILTPDQLVAPSSQGLASAADVAAAWTALLQEIQLEAFEAVFPHVPEKRDANWSTSLAQQLASLQNQLGEYGLDFSDVARSLAAGHVEAERWVALANLENAWNAFLAAKDLISPNTAKRRAAEEANLPMEISRVLVAGVIDPLPLALRVLEKWAESLPVEVISSGDPVIFDEWGRVREEAATGRVLPLGERASVHVVRDIKAGAELAASLAGEYKEAPPTLALSAVHPRATPALEVALRARQLEGHDLSGVALGTVGIGLLATLLLESMRDPRPIFIAQIFRHPEFAAFATQKQSWASDGAELLRALDDVINQHLPNDAESLLAFARDYVPQKVSADAQTSFSLLNLEGAVQWIVDCGRQMRRRGVAQTLRSTLVAIAGARAFDLSQEQDRERAEELEQLGEILEQFAEVERRFPSLGAEAATLVLKAALQHARRFPSNAEEGWDLQGWLELPYEDAPHLVLLGVNEGAIPETIRGDLFLPNSLRELLQLRGNAARARRDQILLEGYLRARQTSGRVDIIVPRASDQGEPWQPSRLLFACDDSELVARAKLLFGALPPPRATSARRAAWQLAPLSYTPPATFSPSKLKQYLLCPYRYYLRHILRMESVETEKHELSAVDFGNLCHFALERLGKDTRMRDQLDPHILAEYLVDALNDEAAKMLGRVATFALQVQLESARARLRAAAYVEAAERAQGWRVSACEQPWTLTLDNMVINGRIDRIDRHEESGSYRLIDYKTSDKGRPPEEAHWKRYPKPEAHVLPESVFTMDGKSWRWLDLQLPLYLLAMREKFGTAVSAGYFVLPKTKESTAIRLWTQLTPDHLLHAEATAKAIGAAVAAGRFWPPAENTYEDDFDFLFPDGFDKDVDAAAMMALFQGKAASHG